MTTIYPLGCLLTPAKFSRSIYLGPRESTTIDLPMTFDMRPDLTAVRDQGRQGSCVAHAGVVMKEWQERKEIGYRSQLSPQFIYNLRTNYPSEGMYLSDLMRILSEKGVCREYLLPYESTSSPSSITQAAYKDALNFKIKSYAEIPYGSDVTRVKSTLVLNGPAIIAFPVYNYTSKFWIQRSGDNFIGNHAVAIVGYTNDSFIIRNSWGQNWGDRGYTFFSFDDYSAGKYHEIWTSVDDKSEVVPPPPPSDKCCLLV